MLKNQFLSLCSPSVPMSSVSFPEPDFAVSVGDAALDLLYPIGFAVERDGERIDVTAGTSFTDTEVDVAGMHTYSISSIYVGGNESGAVSVDINLLFDGLESLRENEKTARVRYLDL